MPEINPANVEAIQLLLRKAVEKFNDQSPPDQQLQDSPDTPLFGQDGKLDSLGLVNFILLVEEEISLYCGAYISLANDKAMSRKRSPFATVQSLADYISELLGDENNA